MAEYTTEQLFGKPQYTTEELFGGGAPKSYSTEELFGADISRVNDKQLTAQIELGKELSPLAKGIQAVSPEALKTVQGVPIVGSLFEPAEQNAELPIGVGSKVIKAAGKVLKDAKATRFAGESSINLKNWDSTEEVKQLAEATVKAGGIKKKRISMAETAAAGEELAWDTKEFLKQAKEKGGFSAKEVDAMRQVTVNATEDLFSTVKSIPTDPMQRTQAMRLDVMDKYNNLVQVMKANSEKAGEAGRALNQMKRMVANNPEYAVDARRKKVLESMMDTFGANKLTDDMIDDLSKVDFKNVGQVRSILEKYDQSKLTDKIYFAWMNGLLSAPPTHFANIIGNTGAIAMKVPEHFIETALKGKSPLGQAKAELVGMLNGIADGARAGLQAWKTGIPGDLTSKAELRNLNPIKGTAGKIIGAPTRALTAADEFFKGIIYRSELNRNAYLKTAGLTGKARDNAMLEMMGNPASDGFKAIHELAEKEALYRTYQKPLGEFGNSLMRLRESTPLVKYVLPFIRTPINIAKYTLERTPLGLLKIARDVSKGKLTKDRLAETLSRVSVGSLIAGAVTTSVLDGKITGGPPDDPKERQLREAAGEQWYSLKLGDTYYSYNRFEPVGSIIGMTADFVNTAKSDEEINKKSALLIKSLARNITSKTFVQGLSSALDVVLGTDEYKMEAWMERTAGSVIPAVVARGASAMDPYVRDADNPLESIQSRIPGASRSLPYKPEVTLATRNGIPITKPKMKEGGPIAQMFSPVMTKTEPADAALYKSLLARHEFEKKQSKAKREALKETIKGMRRTQ